jgi:hypothetical protein
MLESVKELMTQDTYSLTSETESESADQELFSLKTLKELSQQKPPTGNQFFNMSSESWKDWVTNQRLEYSQRVKSAHHTSEKECSSWATPEALNHSGYQMSNGKKVLRLGSQAMQVSMKKNWPTPNVGDEEKRVMRAGKGQSSKSLSSLAVQGRLANWSTPTCHLAKEGAFPAEYMRKTPTLTAQAVGLQDQLKHLKNGRSQGFYAKQKSSPGRLNPNWVEQLMGIPVKWTDLGSWATE